MAGRSAEGHEHGEQEWQDQVLEHGCSPVPGHYSLIPVPRVPLSVGPTIDSQYLCQAEECQSACRPQETHDMKPANTSNIRREFYKAVGYYLRVVWPILSTMLIVIVMCGLIISYLEGWDPFDGIYFGFVTGLTIGYGELVPKLPLSRILAILLGFNGVLLTAIFAAISVRSIEIAVRVTDGDK
jgi:hypothetical protein